jgi:hypothetical protein
MAYASDTEVPVDRTRLEIERMLRLHGANEFAAGWDDTHDKLQFKLGPNVIRFMLPKVDPNADDIKCLPNGRDRKADAVARLIAQRDRSRWRALYLVIKAKLEAVQAGIAIFEQEFLAFIVTADGLTVGDHLVPRLQAGTGPLQLPASTKGPGHK